jgi:hypothetical protein
MPTQNPSAQPRYIWQHSAWPQLTFDATALAPALDLARLEQGRLLGLLDTQGIDVTSWVQWFVQAFTRACVASQAVVRDATDKAHFRLRAAQCHINPRQSKVLERLLEAGHVGSGGGFLGGMSTDKYAKITGVVSIIGERCR